MRDHVVQEAFEESGAADGAVDVKKFLAWYRAHIFELEAKESSAEDSTLELAKK